MRILGRSRLFSPKVGGSSGCWMDCECSSPSTTGGNAGLVAICGLHHHLYMILALKNSSHGPSKRLAAWLSIRNHRQAIGALNLAYLGRDSRLPHLLPNIIHLALAAHALTARAMKRLVPNVPCAIVSAHLGYSFPLALALIFSASDAEIFPACSERVAPPIASRAWVGSLTGNERPGPAKELFGIFLRSAAYSFMAYRFTTE